ncbi:hypothetical protein AVXHC19_29580 [Acidovorax sacchari]
MPRYQRDARANGRGEPVALQHGHSVLMRDYAKWIPSADCGANRAAVNAAISGPMQEQKKAI